MQKEMRIALLFLKLHGDVVSLLAAAVPAQRPGARKAHCSESLMNAARAEGEHALQRQPDVKVVTPVLPNTGFFL
ncbi:MAG TPA: hypothetical protein VGE12_14405 [Noviherbaspirillum sp.]